MYIYINIYKLRLPHSRSFSLISTPVSCQRWNVKGISGKLRADASCDYFNWWKEKMASSNRDAVEGLILRDGLTLAVLHNHHLQLGCHWLSATHFPALPPPQYPISSGIILHAWIQTQAQLCGQTSCWHLPRCSSDQLMPSAEARTSGDSEVR